MIGKRWSIPAVVLAVMLCLSGCSSVVLEQEKTALFTSGGMEIVLPDTFREQSADGYTVCYGSPTVTVFALREAFSLADGVEDMTVREYADLVYLAYAARSPSPITEEDGLPLMEYTHYEESRGKNFVCLNAMYKAEDAFWIIEFVCAEADYEEYRPQFIEWAKSVKFVPAE